MLFTVKNLSVERNKKTLLDSVSFEVCRGEYLCIIGPNGAGKSTLLKCLDNIIASRTGEILFDGKSLTQYPQSVLAQQIAFVQQSAAFSFSFTVQQLTEMGRYPHLKTLSPISEEDRKIVNEAMEAMDVLRLKDRTMETLSGGEKQKVHIAAALAQKADIIFLDEPTAYLDYKYQGEIGKLLRSLNQKEGKTVIEVTHDVNRAVADATHVLALSAGKVVFDGSPSRLMQPGQLRNVFDIDFQFADHPTLPLKLVVPGI
ncbi:iron-dicitrate ABC transporter ATP-binding protein [Planctomycetales bacterium]|nr:iron-dicitrate ABC transporter ATP-binding protein [Planctomycetales bacterium]